MEISMKLTKGITETKYLATENTWRYRPILRYFYLQYEKIKYWMYKEEVYDELKQHELFREYTLDQCKQDLDVLVEWGNLVAVQDTTKAATVEEFKNKQFRYQLSEYAVEIERMTIKLENLFVEGASLEPTLFERIKEEIIKISVMADEEIKTVGAWWRDLNDDFKRLNQNYQDYIRSFHSVRAEELMKTKEFIAYKDAIIEYLREFIKELQKSSYIIEELLQKIDQNLVKTVLSKAFEYEKTIPRMDMEVTDQELYDNIDGRWENFRSWFLGSSSRESEVVKLFEMTNEIIRKITRFASQIVESRNSAANRKEEYKKLCEMFLHCSDMDEAHKLSSLAFGMFNTKHIKGIFMRKTESIHSSVYEETPFTLEIKPRVRYYRDKISRSPIEDKSERKKEIFEQYIRIKEQEKEVMDRYIEQDYIDFSSLPKVQSHVRLTLLKWVGKASTSPSGTAKTEDGRVFQLLIPDHNKRCMLESEDGNLEMPAYIIKFIRHTEDKHSERIGNPA
jgi:uncharacterized protein (TIGR02677 family)